MTKELQPCPFCGQKSNLGKIGREWWRIESSHDMKCILFGEGIFDFQQTQEGLEELYYLWNMRHNPLIPKLEALIEKYENLLKPSKYGQYHRLYAQGAESVLKELTKLIESESK